MLSQSGLLALGSLVAIAVLVVLLWNPSFKKTSGDEELVLYCAAGLVKPVNEICQEYEEAYHVKILIEPDGSGKLLSKMRVARDRGDLFLAADESYIHEARKDGLVAEAIPVASIHPVLVTAKDNPKHIATVRDLLRPDVRVALANPDLAAIGKAAKQALAKTGEWAELEKQIRQFTAKVSQLGTVNEVAQAVKIGTVDAGIVWDATARQFELPLIEAPAFQKARENVTLGVLTRTPLPQRALHFARFLSARDKGLVHFRSHHYEPVPDADDWADTPKVTLMTGAMLRPALEEVVKEFQEREGVEIDWVYNGCGILVAQMKGGVRPAAYFSCDVKFMEQVQPFFLPPVTISRNDLILLVKKGNPHNIKSLADLTRPGLRVGLAHPEKAALGELTKQMLERQGLYRPLVDSHNWTLDSPTGDYLVNQIRTGSVDAVVVYRSNALANPENVANHLDLIELDTPGAQAVQPFAVGRDSEHKYLMRRLLEAIRTPESQRRFEALGFHWAAQAEAP